MKTAELEGSKLDFYVAKALGHEPRWWANFGWVPATILEQVATQSKWKQIPKYSTDWGAGGPLIDTNKICICPPGFMLSGIWEAFIDPILDSNTQDIVGKYEGFGDAPLTACMRCIVIRKFGDEVPDL